MPPLSDRLRAWLRSQIDRLPDPDSASDWPRRFEKEHDLLVIDGSNAGLWFLGIDGDLYFVDRDRVGLTLELETDPATVRRVLESAARDLPELRELLE